MSTPRPTGVATEATPTLACLVFATSLAGCADASIDDDAPRTEATFGERRPLADNTRWAEDLFADPHVEHQPEVIECDAAARQIEGSTLELDTGPCNYHVVAQPSTTDVTEGDRVIVRAFHDQLYAPEPAEAHLSLTLDGHVLWDERIAIPSPATPYTVTLDADFDAPAGRPLVLHLHNHGVNTYRLVDVTVEPLH